MFLGPARSTRKGHCVHKPAPVLAAQHLQPFLGLQAPGHSRLPPDHLCPVPQPPLSPLCWEQAWPAPAPFAFLPSLPFVAPLPPLKQLPAWPPPPSFEFLPSLPFAALPHLRQPSAWPPPPAFAFLPSVFCAAPLPPCGPPIIVVIYGYDYFYDYHCWCRCNYYHHYH